MIANKALKKALKIASDNGCEASKKGLEALNKADRFVEEGKGHIVAEQKGFISSTIRRLIISVPFAKAFFGDDWEEHIKNMAVRNDRIEYIKEYLEEKE